MPDGECGPNDSCEDSPPPIDELVIEILQEIGDTIYDPARTEPIQIPLPDGSMLVIMPVGYSPGSPASGDAATVSTLLSYAGMWLDFGELTAIAIPVEGFAADWGLSGLDVLATGGSCALSGQCYFNGQPHPSLPEMSYVVNQDFLLSTIDLAAPPVAGLAVTALTEDPVAGVFAELATDATLTTFSWVHDMNRLTGSWRNHISVGVRGSQPWILVYP